jgi:hypothetical protein
MRVSGSGRRVPRAVRDRAARREAWLGRGLALGLAALTLAACAGVSASGPEAMPGAEAGTALPEKDVRDRNPGTPVAKPYAPGEQVAVVEDGLVNAGTAGNVVYWYLPDLSLARVATAPDVTWADLSYERLDWEIRCAPGVSGCVVRIAGDARGGGTVEPAVEIRYAADAGGFVLCVGPTDARAGAVRGAPLAAWQEAGTGGCFDAPTSKVVLDELKTQERFSYRYVSGAGGTVDSWRPAFGLATALGLAQWMEARLGRS